MSQKNKGLMTLNINRMKLRIIKIRKNIPNAFTVISFI
jgi:hypothetical protein